MNIRICLLFLATAFGLAFGKEWSTCSKLCGGGTRTRTKQCIFGPVCTQYESEFCNTQPCAPSHFDVYTPCSKSCGGGHRFKVKRCPENHVDICIKTYEECNTKPCKPRKFCPSDQKFRYESLSSCCKKSTDTCGVPDEPKARAQQRVIGGVESKSGQWPWMAVIVRRRTETTHCSGSLIHKDYILTAAHCVNYRVHKEKDFYVLLGSTKIKFPEATRQIIDIEKFIPHEQHSFSNHDIGLVKLKKSAKFNDHVKPICLPNGEKMKLDMSCVAAGWGIARMEHIEHSVASNTLQHVTVRNLPKDACVNGFNKLKNYSTIQHLCFGILSGGKGTCYGDSGGPIMCQRCSSCGWYVAGTTAYIPKKCVTKGQPSVNMYVKNYEYWIRNKISGIPKKSFSC